MAAIQGKWYAASNGHDSYPADPGTVRFVYADQPDGERYIVAKVWSDDGDDYESNARLIAAAPAMLDALCEVRDALAALDWEGDENWRHWDATKVDQLLASTRQAVNRTIKLTKEGRSDA
jgi:hypothetical protein